MRGYSNRWLRTRSYGASDKEKKYDIQAGLSRFRRFIMFHQHTLPKLSLNDEGCYYAEQGRADRHTIIKETHVDRQNIAMCDLRRCRRTVFRRTIPRVVGSAVDQNYQQSPRLTARAAKGSERYCALRKEASALQQRLRPEPAIKINRRAGATKSAGVPRVTLGLPKVRADSSGCPAKLLYPRPKTTNAASLQHVHGRRASSSRRCGRTCCPFLPEKRLRRECHARRGRVPADGQGTPRQLLPRGRRCSADSVAPPNDAAPPESETPQGLERHGHYLESDTSPPTGTKGTRKVGTIRLACGVATPLGRSITSHIRKGRPYQRRREGNSNGPSIVQCHRCESQGARSRAPPASLGTPRS